MGKGSLFPEVKRPGCGVNHLTLSSAEVKERVQLHLYVPSGPSWLAIGRNLLYLTVLIHVSSTIPSIPFIRILKLITFYCWLLLVLFASCLASNIQYCSARNRNQWRLIVKETKAHPGLYRRAEEDSILQSLFGLVVMLLLAVFRVRIRRIRCSVVLGAAGI
jgi:hypothetical protein